MKVLVCGGRDGNDRRLVDFVLNHLNKDGDIKLVVQGGATGYDRLARDWAFRNGVPQKEYKADWANLNQPDAMIRTRKDGVKYDARAGSRRNQKMLDEEKPDLVVAFPGGFGTGDMVRRSLGGGFTVWEVSNTGSIKVLMKPGSNTFKRWSAK